MTLYFRSDQPDMMARRDQFVALCKRKGIPGMMKQCKGKWAVKTYPRNVTEDRKLLAAWATQTVEIVDGQAPTPSLFGRKKNNRK